MRLNKNLLNLLKDLKGRVDEEDRKIINQTLHDVGGPLTIWFPIISCKVTINITSIAGRG
jgi:hypothetical protein